MNASPVTLDTQGLVALVSFFIPLAVAALTKKESKSWEKQATSIGFNGLLTALVLIFEASGHVTFYVVVITFANSVIVSLGSYKALLNVGATGVVASTAAPALGIGSSIQPTIPDDGNYVTPTVENQVSNMEDTEQVAIRPSLAKATVAKPVAKKAAPKKRAR